MEQQLAANQRHGEAKYEAACLEGGREREREESFVHAWNDVWSLCSFSFVPLVGVCVRVCLARHAKGVESRVESP